MNVTELVRPLQAEYDGTATRADSLRGHRSADHRTRRFRGPPGRAHAIRKVIDAPTPPDDEPALAEAATVYQRIVTAFTEDPGRVFRIRDLHELLKQHTGEPSINVTRPRLGRLVRQGLLDQPGRG